ncbi:hypothetical protein [Type-D symbiont of Plautia stali]|uniref:hypothetical protein n=1 Tax=Type-D symbiont of Plautia stali TaxID=1560356 RepID=UPI00073EBEDD|nr:hypothetical protein [Type-D symbiont of Plautia stali]
MEKTSTEATFVPLLTGIIGEAVLELIDRGRNVSREDIVTMLEKKKRACELLAVARVIDDALFWMRKDASS